MTTRTYQTTKNPIKVNNHNIMRYVKCWPSSKKATSGRKIWVDREKNEYLLVKLAGTFVFVEV